MQCVVDVCRAAGHTRGGELLNTVHRVVRFYILYLLLIFKDNCCALSELLGDMHE